MFVPWLGLFSKEYVIFINPITVSTIDLFCLIY